jgi:hypothetical protein
MAGITYDTGALLAAEKGNRALWALHKRALDRGIRPTVPAGVLAQAWRGGPQAALSRFLAGCRFEPLNEAASRAIGVACARSKRSDIVDASVVLGAIAREDAVYTSDSDDLVAIANALDEDLVVYRV